MNALPAEIDRALAAFRELTTAPIPADVRALRMRLDVLAPLARHYGDSGGGGLRLGDAPPEFLAYHGRASQVGARACLVVLGSGRDTLSVEVLREVARFGEAFCVIQLQVQARQDPEGRDVAARLGIFHLQATLSLVAAEATQEVDAARTARRRFGELGDEGAVAACDRLLATLGVQGLRASTGDGLEDDGLRTEEMDLAFLVTGPGSALHDTPPEMELAPTDPPPALVARPGESPGPRPLVSAELPGIVPRRPLSTRELAALPGEVPTPEPPETPETPEPPEPPEIASVPPAPALRPVPPARARPANRAEETRRPTVITAAWPPPRSATAHQLATVAVAGVLLLGGLAAFSAARRAVSVHRAQQADARAAEASSSLQSSESGSAATLRADEAASGDRTGSGLLSSADRRAGARTPFAQPDEPPVPAEPTFTVSIAPRRADAAYAPGHVPAVTPPDAALPPPSRAPETTPPTGAPPSEPATAPPPPPSEPPRARARRLNTEGFRAYEAGDQNRAREAYRKATEADPTFALPWYNLACIEALHGRVDTALEALETFHRLDPRADLVTRIRADRDFARVRDLAAFKRGVEALVGAAP